MGRGLLYYIKPSTVLFLTSNVILFMLSIPDLKMLHLSRQVNPLDIYVMKLLLFPVELVTTMLLWRPCV